MDIFGPDLHYANFTQYSESPLAFSHSVHQQAGILEVFLAITFRPRLVFGTKFDFMHGTELRKSLCKSC